jgi:hypothetical protein
MGEAALALLFFALGVAVIVLFVLATLTHGVIRDLHANQKVIYDLMARLRTDLETVRGDLEELQEGLDYGRRNLGYVQNEPPPAYRPLKPGMVEEQP